jgi:radical SAM superfamily enzyme YgiQ (UPF0313 family)
MHESSSKPSVLLISTYELGRQPFGLASPAAWLRDAGAQVRSLDLSREPFDEAAVRDASLIAFYLPMHTATRLAVPVIKRVRKLNPQARLCAYGLYAPMNSDYLRKLGVDAVFGGEFESRLVQEWRNTGRRATEVPAISLDRLHFRVPYRDDLPSLERYAHLTLPDGTTRVVGYTEASRGCKHLCRHCPVVPVYGGAFRIVQRHVVLEDIRRQVAAGAQHITFGDPDFFNGPAHAMEIVRALHGEHPTLSYDVTIKVEHLLQHSTYLAELCDTGCAFVTTAVESLDDELLARLEKGHTRADFFRTTELMNSVGLFLVPTFIPFTPWTTLESYEDLLRTIAQLRRVEQVPPVQLTIRLLIPAGSRLLELEEVQQMVGAFDEQALSYPWANPDCRVDRLQREVEVLVYREAQKKSSRTATFAAIWKTVTQAMDGTTVRPLPLVPPGLSRATIPYLTEPWYC